MEVPFNLLHPAFLLDSKGTAAFAVTAMETGIGFDAELGVVVGGNFIPGLGQVVILVHQTDIDACGAGLAVVAVDAGAGNGVSGKCADDGVILFRLRGIQEF